MKKYSIILIFIFLSFSLLSCKNDYDVGKKGEKVLGEELAEFFEIVNNSKIYPNNWYSFTIESEYRDNNLDEFFTQIKETSESTLLITGKIYFSENIEDIKMKLSYKVNAIKYQDTYYMGHKIAHQGSLKQDVEIVYINGMAYYDIYKEVTTLEFNFDNQETLKEDTEITEKLIKGSISQFFSKYINLNLDELISNDNTIFKFYGANTKEQYKKKNIYSFTDVDQNITYEITIKSGDKIKMIKAKKDKTIFTINKSLGTIIREPKNKDEYKESKYIVF